MQVEAQASRVRGFELAPSTFRLLATASAFALYVIIVSGATVRLTGSGLGCEGWPGCTPGAVFPEKDYHSFVEFGNRVVSALPDPALARDGDRVALPPTAASVGARVRVGRGRSGRSRRRRSA